MIAVAFCTDLHMEAALHVAASSLLRNLVPSEQVRFYCLLTGFPEHRIAKLRTTLDRTGRAYELRLLTLRDDSLFQGLRPLHGSFVPYYRLLLPDLVEEKRLLYLDSDTLPMVDVAPLFSLDLAGKASGFVVDGIVRTSLENGFFLSQGMRPDGPVFNSGVMLFDVEAWHRQQCRQRCMEFCGRHHDKLQTADQTALNVLFSEDTYHLPLRYNVKLYPLTPVEGVPQDALYHFVGSPKPWDIGGAFLVSGYSLWHQAATQTDISISPYLSWLAWRRSGRILGAYRRELARKFK